MKTLTLTVFQFNSFVKQIFDAEEFLSNIAIIGEVTNFKISGDNAFFDLKDENAMISCVKFGASDLNIKNGQMVQVIGKVNFYIKSGRLNFLVRQASPYGQGDLYQKFLMLKEKLEKEGYFREEIKKEIPKFAKKIGVVTSPTGAVIRDIINVTKSKNPYTDIIVYPAKVQGIGAENEIAKGIRYFNTRDDIDTIIVARGGGSLEDLSPFNTERVVLEIFASKKPIISAVGHEIDFTLCDFASDLRVPTPSVGAEVAVFDYFEQVEKIKKIAQSNFLFLSKKLSDNKKHLGLVTDSIIDKIKLKITSSKLNLKSSIESISNKIGLILSKKKTELDKTILEISKHNPLEILKNGYAVLMVDGKKISNSKALNVGDKIEIDTIDSKIDAVVGDISPVNYENLGDKE